MAITTSPANAFGRWLLDRFAERGWDAYRQAGAYLGISHTQLRSYVMGVTPRPPVLTKLADFFGVERAELEALLGLARPAFDDAAIRDFIRLTARLTVEEALARLGVAASDWTPRMPPAAPDDPEGVALAADVRLVLAQASPERREELQKQLRANLRRWRRDAAATDY